HPADELAVEISRGNAKADDADPSPEQKGLERDDMIPVASVYPAYVIGNGSRAARELSRTARLGMSLEIAGGAQVTGYRKACPLQPSVCLPFYFFFGYFP